MLAFIIVQDAALCISTLHLPANGGNLPTKYFVPLLMYAAVIKFEFEL
jgi:hypothetical protein